MVRFRTAAAGIRGSAWICSVATFRGPSTANREYEIAQQTVPRRRHSPGTPTAHTMRRRCEISSKGLDWVVVSHLPIRPTPWCNRPAIYPMV